MPKLHFNMKVENVILTTITRISILFIESSSLFLVTFASRYNHFLKLKYENMYATIFIICNNLSTFLHHFFVNLLLKYTLHFYHKRKTYYSRRI